MRLDLQESIKVTNPGCRTILSPCIAYWKQADVK